MAAQPLRLSFQQCKSLLPSLLAQEDLKVNQPEARAPALALALAPAQDLDLDMDLDHQMVPSPQPLAQLHSLSLAGLPLGSHSLAELEMQKRTTLAVLVVRKRTINQWELECLLDIMLSRRDGRRWLDIGDEI